MFGTVGSKSKVEMNKEIVWRTRLDANFRVERNVIEGHGAKTKKISSGNTKLRNTLTPLRPITSNNRQLEENKQLLAKLVIARSTQNGIRDFIAYCAQSAECGTWSKKRER
jgi:formyltetrahydrofolate synthetase